MSHAQQVSKETLGRTRMHKGVLHRLWLLHGYCLPEYGDRLMDVRMTGWMEIKKDGDRADG